MNLSVTSHDMPLDDDMMTFVRVQDKDSQANLTVRFDKSTGSEVVQVMYIHGHSHGSIDQIIEMFKAVKEYRNEA